MKHGGVWRSLALPWLPLVVRVGTAQNVKGVEAMSRLVFALLVAAALVLLLASDVR